MIDQYQSCDILQWNNRGLRGLCGLAGRMRPHGGFLDFRIERILQCSNGFDFSANGECVSKSVVCDGRRDCRDGSDEKSCRKLHSKL